MLDGRHGPAANPRWVVDCRNCLASFTHSEVAKERKPDPWRIYAHFLRRRCGNNRESQPQKIQACVYPRAGLRCPGFSRFGRTGEDGRRVSEKGNDLLTGRSRQECVVRPKRWRETLRYKRSWKGSGGCGFRT